MIRFGCFLLSGIFGIVAAGLLLETAGRMGNDDNNDAVAPAVGAAVCLVFSMSAWKTMRQIDEQTNPELSQPQLTQPQSPAQSVSMQNVDKNKNWI